MRAWLLIGMVMLISCGGGGGNSDSNDNNDNSDINDDTDDTPAFYSVGGIVVGLTRGELVLKNNGADSLTITADGSFSFAASLSDGSTYEVLITSQSTDQVCSVSNSTGSLAGTDVSDVLVSCLPAQVTPRISVGGTKRLSFSWDEVSADHYKLLKNPDGISGYSQVGDNISTTEIDEEISVHLMNWADARYIVQACNAFGDCSDSVPFAATSLMHDVIGYLKEPEIRSDNEFGISTALSGDGTILAVTANRSPTVYVYELQDANWNLQAEVEPSSDYLYRKSVTISGDGSTLAIRASIDGVWSVHIFSRSGDVWNLQDIITASNQETGDAFAADISLSGNGNLLAVSAPGESSNATGINGDQFNNLAESSGAVYLFVRNNAVWKQDAYIKASNTAANDGFGSSLQLSSDGSTLAVGARNAPFPTTRTGTVYIFVSEGNTWIQQAIINASNADMLDFFGDDVALSADGNTLAVGAYGEESIYPLINAGESNNSLHQAGAAYLFKRTDATWTQEVYFKPSNIESSDLFGINVALSSDGTLLAVSATGEGSIATGINGDQTDNSAYKAGAVYLFKQQDDSTWVQHAYIKSANTGEMYLAADYGVWGRHFSNDGYGMTIALSADGTTLMVSAPYEASSEHSLSQDNDDAPLAGAIYLY